MKKIALIGAGQLGSRHLQGLARIDLPVKLYVVDPSLESLRLASDRFSEVPRNKHICSIAFKTSFYELDSDIDLCIIATNADVRYKVLTELVRDRKISSIVLEKVAFQSDFQFRQARDLLTQRDISCWVNCPRRVFPIYNVFKQEIKKNEEIALTVSGGDWGLACNGIHFIDLLAFLAGDSLYQLNSTGLDAQIGKSKRPGFLEVTGRLTGDFAKGSHFSLESAANSNQPLQICIETRETKIHVDENRGVAKIARKKDVWIEEVLYFEVPFQSVLTGTLSMEILESGSCSLTDIAESHSLHQPFLQTVRTHLESAQRRRYDCCPIT